MPRGTESRSNRKKAANAVTSNGPAQPHRPSDGIGGASRPRTGVLSLACMAGLLTSVSAIAGHRNRAGLVPRREPRGRLGISVITLGKEHKTLTQAVTGKLIVAAAPPRRRAADEV